MNPSLESCFSLNELFIRYATALDSVDVDTIVGGFTEDGALENPLTAVTRAMTGSERFWNASRR